MCCFCFELSYTNLMTHRILNDDQMRAAESHDLDVFQVKNGLEVYMYEISLLLYCIVLFSKKKMAADGLSLGKQGFFYY